MNEKFFALPQNKQQAIINAGYRVFSQNSYQKSPMCEIAAAAGISKSLLFHYFHNKKELYLFLWEKCAQITIEYMRQYGCYDQRDFFEMLQQGVQAKVQIMRQYPDMGHFVIKAYFEKDPAVCQEIRKSYEKFINLKANSILLHMEPSQFAPGLDLKMMYQQMYWASIGYLCENIQPGQMDIDRVEQDCNQMIEFWQKVYQRKDVKHGSNLYDKFD